jgi:hypothetical protein
MTPVVCSQLILSTLISLVSMTSCPILYSCMSLVPSDFLMVTLAGLAVIWPTGNLGSVCLMLSLCLLELFPVCRRALSWGLLFYVIINNLCNSINHSKFLFFADDLDIFRIIDTPHDYLLLQNYIHSVSDWCSANFMSINIDKTPVISYSRKTNVLLYEYQLCTSCVKDLGVFLINCTFTIILILYFLNV